MKELIDWITQESLKVNEYSWNEKVLLHKILDKIKELEGVKNEL